MLYETAGDTIRLLAPRAVMIRLARCGSCHRAFIAVGLAQQATRAGTVRMSAASLSSCRRVGLALGWRPRE